MGGSRLRSLWPILLGWSSARCWKKSVSTSRVEGVFNRLVTYQDERGDLTVLFSELHETIAPIPHVYLVTAAPGSIRAWVYHKRQTDCLAFTNGVMRIVLYDLRTSSRTWGVLNVIDAGASNKVLLTIRPKWSMAFIIAAGRPRHS